MRPLNKREQKKLTQKAAESKNRKLTTLFYIALLLSIFVSLYSYVQYQWIIIDYKIPLLIFIASGLLLSGVIKKYFESSLKANGIKIQWFWYFFSGGAMCMGCCFFANKLFSESKVYTIKAPIADAYVVTRTKRGIKSITVEVELKSFNKDLSFPIEDEDIIANSDFVVLHVSKGALGFEVIKDRTFAE